VPEPNAIEFKVAIGKL